MLNSLHAADYIQLAILGALVWYSLETHGLRKAQKKGLYLQMLEMEMRDKDSGYKARIRYPYITRKIMELGKFDVKDLYSSGWHQPLSTGQKFWTWVKARCLKKP